MDRIYELTPVPTLVLDPFLRIVRASNSLLEHLSVASDKCVGQDLYDCLESHMGLSGWWPLHEAIQEATADRRPKTASGLKNLYGNVYHFRVVPIFEDQLLHVVVEIDAAADAQLPSTPPQPPPDYLRQALDALDRHPVFMLGPSGHIEAWSTTAASLTGYAKADVIDEPCSILFDNSAEEKETLQAFIARSGKSTCTMEHWICTKNGTRFFAEITMSPASAGCLAVILQDITNRHAAEVNLLSQAAQAKENRKVVFRESVASLLRIQDATAQLRASTLDEDQLLVLDKIEGYKRSLSREIQSLSNIDHYKVVDVRAVIQETMSAHFNHMRPNLQYKHDTASRIPSELTGLHDAFREVFNVLLTTAVTVSRKGSIQVKAVVTEESFEKCEIRVSIIDEGKSLKAQDLKNYAVSSLFKTQEHSTKPKNLNSPFVGVAHLIRLMSGSIGHQQNPAGDGNVLWFTCSFKKRTPDSQILQLDSAAIRVFVMQKDLAKKRFIVDSLHALGVTKIDTATSEELMVSRAEWAPEPYDIIFVDFDSDESAAAAAVGKLRQLKAVKTPLIVPVAMEKKVSALRSQGFQTIVPTTTSRSHYFKAALDAAQGPVLNLSVRGKEKTGQTSKKELEDSKDSDWVEL